MKLASLNEGRDGKLIVVSHDLKTATLASGVAPTLQTALEDWTNTEPKLEKLAAHLEAGKVDSFAFDANSAASPLPRAYQWLDAGAYIHHMELARRARGADMPPNALTEPAMHQGASDDFRGPTADMELIDPEHGLDLEAEVCVVLDDVPVGVSEDQAAGHIKLLMLVNDLTLRNILPGELAKGVGFIQSKVANSYSPVAVTPAALGEHWKDGKLCLPIQCHLNETLMGNPDCGVDMTFNFPRLISHAAKTRNLRAGTILGSGTVSNRDHSKGSCCLAEKRMIETGEATTQFLSTGDTVQIEVLDPNGQSVFGAIRQRVVQV
ncbi:fumarylacetoacetate hydrolase family protein [Yoonia sp. 2307UL14-13]|uniref:fumarylacetoacetate hydrolase family protein n=1 Tax=Yoonia sp. 2307UL14-13 TaxID=3126506 RepID=UPI0030A7B25F